MRNKTYNRLLYKKIYLYSIGDYITYISKNRNIKFQMDIFRNNIIDVQILHNDLNYKNSLITSDKKKIILIISLTEHLSDRSDCLERFRKSHLYENFIPLNDEKLKNRYILEINKNWDDLFDVTTEILYNIYNYSEKDTYSVRFFEFVDRKSYLVNNTYVSWFDYFFNRK